ncbi:alpha/beta fold hydrolase [Candidatus Woesearchaeota archaeon]|nr:MAG: alpha/beta fold hydrolase [Candidatus Woesearchaeota archaeon]
MAEYPFRGQTEGVFFELGVPDKHARVHDAVVYCPGLPSSPHYPRLLKQLQARGYVGVALRYRGTWESAGRFLERTPVADVQAVLRMLRRGGFTELFGGTRVRLNVRNIFLVGSSFGGLVALQALKKPAIKVKKAVLLAPVISFAALGGPESHEAHARVLVRAWPNAYRFNSSSYGRLVRDELIGDGMARLRALAGKQLLIFHSRNDPVVSIAQSRRFVRAAQDAGITTALQELRQGHSIRLRAPQVEKVCRFFR